jgi:hypothetical protein
LLLALAATAHEDTAIAATQVVAVSASVNKPLSLTRLQDLDLGTITLRSGSWSGATVGISRAGNFSCSNPNTVCSGTARAASYNVQGQNRMVVRISAPDVTLVNQSDPSQTVTLVIDSPGTVTLTSSGVPGVDFALGGSVTLNSTTAEGLYIGSFNVTVDY